ncbi:uncharacterized protein LOC127715413 [Mytilus californianus]|uniref:uncharacterized protein LOC127715413 n=1 Tax=Mytilus californianus TaxID=6549 RepID=UPI0022453978|nr:uncharacterized protein LOC127715413 [Mytilus californianus]
MEYFFVPIGVKGSSKEDLEWRISFSIGEQLLINTFTHTQLLCYALIKILLKDVIATFSECKELLCSYFLKTIIFWISEELPQSAWRPDTLIPCFMQCFKRLIYCVEYSVCLHYFIPENNMFKNKIEGRPRKILLEKLYTLHNYGWRCILFSDQVSNFPASVRYFNMEQQRSYVHKVEKATKAYLLWSADTSFLLCFNWDKVLCSSLLKTLIQKAVSFDKSLIKYLYIYYTSMICSNRAHYIPLNIAYSNNEYQLRLYKSCLCNLLKNIYHDSVSGWLMLASFFYNTKEHTKALHILKYSLSKCTLKKLFYTMELSDIHNQLLKLKSLQKKSIVHLWKLMFIDEMSFKLKSMLIPEELLLEVENRSFSISSSVYAYFLKFLCHYHLNDIRACQDTIQVLQLVIEEKYLMVTNLKSEAAAYSLLGVAFQMFCDTESARQTFLKSVELHNTPSGTPAAKRLMLMCSL